MGQHPPFPEADAAPWPMRLEPESDSAEGVVAAVPASSATGNREPRLDNRKIAVGAAIGIGSAAIVAALLYANRDRKAPGKK